MKVEGLQSLLANLKLRERQALAASGASVIVGYTAAYSLFVHENLQARHAGYDLTSSTPPKRYVGVGQAKFLEQPARQNQDKYARIARDAMQRGLPMVQALYLAGLALQRDSQQLCPVHTANMKNSAVTRVES